MQLDYAIVFVSDMSHSIQFYREILGLTLKYETSEWSEFITGGITLALHGGGISDPDSPIDRLKSAGQCRPGFSVSDLDEFHARMVDNGIVCVQLPKNVFGVWIAQYTDPDGLVISVSERAAAA